ncbi:MAG: thermonuclease family protein [Anaerolineae bacterium]|nr:thermonuclease family protein [Anaerolineae bacterium]
MALMRISARLLALWVISVFVLVGCIPEDEPESPGATNPPGEIATVVEVIDGDTIDVRMNGEVYRVRYIGVDTPERDERCYSDATAANARLVENETVTLVRDVSETDPYGRLLRYVYADGVFVNAQLVAQGYAESRAYPPDTANQDYFDSLETTARQQSLGCLYN